MQHSVRRKRKAARDRVGIFLLTLAVLIGGALLATSAYLRGQRPTLDKNTMCPVDGPKGLIVLLVDTTDPLTTVQRADLANHLQAIKEGVPKYCAIDVYSVASTGGALLSSQGERICNPGDGRDASAFTSNPKLLQEKWKSKFSRPLDQLFDQMLTSKTSEHSPIMESIQSVSVTAFGRLPGTTTDRKLILISDMLHNTPEYSQYRFAGSFEEFRRTPYYRRIRADLRGVDVEIYYLRRDQGVQGKEHIEFWQQYFADCGATLSHVVALQG